VNWKRVFGKMLLISGIGILIFSAVFFYSISTTPTSGSGDTGAGMGAALVAGGFFVIIGAVLTISGTIMVKMAKETSS